MNREEKDEIFISAKIQFFCSFVIWPPFPVGVSVCVSRSREDIFLRSFSMLPFRFAKAMAQNCRLFRFKNARVQSKETPLALIDFRMTQGTSRGNNHFTMTDQEQNRKRISSNRKKMAKKKKRIAESLNRRQHQRARTSFC